MQGNIIGDDFDPGVINEINLRQSIHGSGFNKKRTPQQIQFLNNRNAWLKLASSVYVIGDNTEKDFEGSVGDNQLLGIATDNNINGVADGVERLKGIGITDTENFVGNQLAQKCVLFNTLSGAEFNSDGTFKKYNQRSGVTKSSNIWNSSNSYGLGGSTMGLSPAPGLIDCSIDCVNRGSIRKAQVSLKAYNKFQFELIELLYLRLGFTMMLEWGWDKYMDDNGSIQQVQTTIIEDQWFNNKGANQHSVIRNIEKYREKYQYNYDGFFGKVSNFDWTFNSDGTYDITIDLITIGDVIESITARNKVLALSPDQLKDAVDKASSSWKPWEANFYQIGDKGIGKLKDSTIVSSAGETSLGNWMFKAIVETPWADQAGTPSHLFSWENSREYYNSEDGSDYPEIPSEHFNYFMTFGHLLKLVQELIMPLIIKETPECVLDIEMNENENLCSTYPNLISFSPEIALIKPHIYTEEGEKKYKSLNYPNYLNDLKEFNIVNGDCVYGKMLNIYINFQFIADTLAKVNEKEELSIFDFLKTITTGINKALGNITQLEPIIKDDYIITIIDQNPIPLLKPKPPTPTFEVFGINPSDEATSNFVTDIKFQTSITPEIASMITIGATAGGSTKNTDATSFSKWNQGIFDRTNPAMIDNPNPPDSVTDYTEEGTVDQDIAWDKGDVVKSKWAQTGINVIVTGGNNIKTRSGKTGEEKEQFTVRKNVTYKGTRWYNVDYTTFLTLARGQDTAKKIFDVITTVISAHPTVKLGKRIFKGIRVWMYDESQQYASNYTLHLVRAFGGEIDVPMNAEGTETKNIQVDTDEAMYNLLSEEFNSIGHQAFNGFANTNNERIFAETSTPSPRIGFIPMSIDLSFEGMSGIKIYNGMALRQRFLPPQYSKALKFIIEKVNHKISDNNWTTDLQTLSVPDVNNKNASPFNNLALTTSGANVSEVVENKGPKNPINLFEDPLEFIDNRSINGVPVDKSTYRKKISLETAVSYINVHAQTEFKNWFTYLKNNGYNDYQIYINAVYRPYSRSVELKKQNPSNAAPGKSVHNYAAGVDLTVKNPYGRWFKKKERRPWQEEGFVDTAKKFNLGWGGSFAGYIDAVHFFKDFNRDTALSNAAADNQGKPQAQWETRNTELEGNKRILKFEDSKVKSRTFTWIKQEKEVGKRSIGEITIMYELPDGTQKEFKGRRSTNIASTKTGVGGYQDKNNRLKQELLKLKSNQLIINVDKYLSNL